MSVALENNIRVWEDRRNKRIASGEYKNTIFGAEWYQESINYYREQLRKVVEEIKSRGK